MSQNVQTSPTRNTHSATKALVAAGLGVVLLAGAGGTFAVWNAQESVSTGTITDGALALSVGEGSWLAADGSAIADIAAYRMVPGDSVTFVTQVTPTIVGDNLQATLVGELPQGPDSFWRIDPALPDGETVLDEDDSNIPVTVEVEVTLPSTSGNESQQAELDLNDLTLTLQQVTSSL